MISSDEEPQQDQVTPKKLTNGHLTNGHGDAGDTQLSAHYKHCFHNKGAYADSSSTSSPVKITNGGDAEQLASLYGVRMREIARLQEVLEETKHNAADKIEELSHKVLQLEAERAAMKSSQAQTQTLLGKN